jgi:hypothetical protein
MLEESGETESKSDDKFCVIARSPLSQYSLLKVHVVFGLYVTLQIVTSNVEVEI